LNTETITVEDVSGPNANGWREVTFEDGRKASTKDEDIAKEAFQSRGNPVEAVISVSKNGKFTNTYLNQINGVGEAKPKGRPSSNGGSKTASRGRTPAENERIARQWAYGRAVELLVGSGAEFAYPLDDATLSMIKTQAESLLNATK